jgi:homoserine kinase type II
MAVFTAVTSDQLADWLEHYSIGKVLEFKGIQSGIENSNFFLTTTRGAYVLTIFEKLDSESLPFYLNLMKHLAVHGVPVPDPLPRDDGSLFGMLHGKPAAIVSKLQGAPQMAPDASHCAELGAMLARMHLAGHDFPATQPNLRSLPWWRATLPTIEPFLNPHQAQLAREELSHQIAWFESADYVALASGPCHCDLFRDNVLFETDADGHQRLGGFFDFYFAGCDKWLFDVAVCVNDWCVDLERGGLDTQRTSALLRAYHAVRPFTSTEAAHWRDMLRAAAFRFWVSRLYDLHLPRQAQMLKPHDPAQFERILRAHIAAPPLPWL